MYRHVYYTSTWMYKHSQDCTPFNLLVHCQGIIQKSLRSTQRTEQQRLEKPLQWVYPYQLDNNWQDGHPNISIPFPPQIKSLYATMTAFTVHSIILAIPRLPLYTGIQTRVHILTECCRSSDSFEFGEKRMNFKAHIRMHNVWTTGILENRTTTLHWRALLRCSAVAQLPTCAVRSLIDLPNLGL